MIPAVGTQVTLNDGEEFLSVVAVGEFITFSDGSWITFRDWNLGVQERIIVCRN
jgi:hypothetical protein